MAQTTQRWCRWHKQAKWHKRPLEVPTRSHFKIAPFTNVRSSVSLYFWSTLQHVKEASCQGCNGHKVPNMNPEIWGSSDMATLYIWPWLLPCLSFTHCGLASLGFVGEIISLTRFYFNGLVWGILFVKKNTWNYIIYLILLSDTDNLVSVWDNLLSVAIVV